MATSTLQRTLKVLVTPDKLRAYVRLSPTEHYGGVVEEDILAALKEAGVAPTDALRPHLEPLLAAMRGDKVANEADFVLAEGSQPTPPADATFVFSDQANPNKTPSDAAKNDNGPIDFFSQCRIQMVEAGTTIGRITPAQHGKSGIDVFGQLIPPPQKPSEIALGDAVKVAEDGCTVVATQSGRVHFTRRYLGVLPLLEIKGNVDFETGSIESPIDVTVRHDVQDGFHVISGKHITVGGSVDAANLQAEGDIHVHGGINGRDKGRVAAKGEVAARFCNEATIQAGGDLLVQREILNSKIHVQGNLIMPRGALIGGVTYARCGAQVGVIGSDADVKTTLAVGPDPDVMHGCRTYDEEAAKRREASGKIRDAVKPLLAQLKRLLPAQRERATELMYEADRLEGEAGELIKKKEETIRSISPEHEPVVEVHTAIQPNTTIIIGDRMTHFAKELKGPVKIAYRRVDRLMEMVALNQLTGSVTVLRSREYQPDPAAPLPKA